MPILNMIPFEVAQSQGTADNWYRMMQAERAAQAQEIDNQRNRFNAALTLRGLDQADVVRRSDDQYALANMLESLRQHREDQQYRTEALQNSREERAARLAEQMKDKKYADLYRGVQIQPVNPDELPKLTEGLDPWQVDTVANLNSQAIEKKYTVPTALSTEAKKKLDLLDAMTALKNRLGPTGKGDWENDEARSKFFEENWKELQGDNPMPKKEGRIWSSGGGVDYDKAAINLKSALNQRLQELNAEAANIRKAMAVPQRSGVYLEIGPDGKRQVSVPAPAWMKQNSAPSSQPASTGGVNRRFVFNPATGEAE